ncbi:16S rRNA (cytosine1402-N4)-methyltransferase [Rhodothalassium salexigens DSM 2132]|uniref:Ribosomal RNA small subunit methyltransferase H n=1 Tax=Rhodothalassium salexigens DSM 2132 TaxID=1188247 RepID=A0A4R2PBU0_RHOSA|nr:16S rRNA (cytosine(1402)-N(4))-methyltransferase RsmH [Rhodothalassium salexigens]MBB4212246.1 16S rRNA (cytosine1402-N4)-methyltransferase [Rhodothalassium salexigens DSM 2132]TCP32603.1 16S rRNA (cytosine1402-N4)-methyltransferase [Rhodothalassium salexigens DSM 2132]
MVERQTPPSPNAGPDAPTGGPHVPVMLDSVLKALSPQDGQVIVDATFGAGGYTRAVLDAARTHVLAFDRDPTAIAAGAALVDAYAGRLTLIERRFGAMAEALAARGVADVDAIVLDIGVSSMQLDRAERGFSFSHDGPLDMRMDAGGAEAGESAADVVNDYDAEDLARIIYRYGEEPRSRRIARAIVEARASAPITRTGRLAEIVAQAVGPTPKRKIHPATTTFQALRIHVNRELDELDAALDAAERLLKPGGRLVVVSFHSLEDRRVKRFLAARTGERPAVSRHQPLPEGPAPVATFRLPSKGAVKPTAAEIAANPRARSARLRVGIRTEAAPRPTGEAPQ